MSSLFFIYLHILDVSAYNRSWRLTGGVDARVHIYTTTALGRGGVASPTLNRLCPGKSA